MLFTNPSRETASGGSASVRSSSSSSNSRRVLRYCETVRRRTRPFFGVGRERATSRARVIHSTICWRSAAGRLRQALSAAWSRRRFFSVRLPTAAGADPRAWRRVGRLGRPTSSCPRCGIARSSVSETASPAARTTASSGMAGAVRRLSQPETRCPHNPSDGKQRESAHGLQSKPTIP